MAQPATTERNEVSSAFQIDRDVAIRCWREVLQFGGVAHNVLAAELGMSESYFSRVSAGEQGDLLGLIYRIGERRPELRRAFVCRLHEREMADPVTVAAGDLVSAAVRFLQLRGSLVSAGGLR